MSPLSYDLNVARWEEDHPEWKLSARFEEHGFVANRRDGTGAAHVARTLDDLAGLVAEEGTVQE